jgi:NAD(P)-dependent dehydrogenase (short-subunit alcohol dehydrogenase family)
VPDVESPILFSEVDLALFSEASGDHNPLHLSAEYARQTPYGERVVFGCLGAIALLGRLKLPVGSIQAEFLRPMFLGVPYEVSTVEKDGGWVTQLLDGSLAVVSLTIKAAPGESGSMTPQAAFFERTAAMAREESEMVRGVEVSGRYACDPAAFARLVKRWGSVDAHAAAVFCWASYLVGMELPGETALFFKAHLTLNPAAPLTLGEYRASIDSVDKRYSQIKIKVSLSGEGGEIASGFCWAFVRPALEVEENESTAVTGSSLAGRVVVLIGGSRGLGAAMKRALDLRGAIVYSLSRTATEEARTEVGDASDPLVLGRLRERILKEQGRLDLLISNASPPLLPLRLEPNGASRIGSYVSSAVAMTLNPLCFLLDLLNASGGCAVVISSQAAEQPVREWPHYVAAKRAAEMLARVAVMQYPRVRTLIVRPPKLLTTLTNTPGGRRGAASPVAFAGRIIGRLEEGMEAGKTEIFG